MKKIIVINFLMVSILFFQFSPKVIATDPSYKYIVELDGEKPHVLANELGVSLISELPALDAVLVESDSPLATITSSRLQGFVHPMPKEPTFFVAAQRINTGFTDLRLSIPHNLALKGDGVKIAILDSGVNVNHPDLQLAGSVSMIEGSSPAVDLSGHGTHVAGIISATDNSFGVLGAVPKAEVYSVKVLEGRIGYLHDVIRGIQWAIDNDMDIVNMSISTNQSDSSLEAILNEAAKKGILIVAAAGNISNTTQAMPDVLYPARYSSVIAVGATNRTESLASFSYRGNSLEVVAPGEQILSTYVSTATSHHDDYSLDSGTSMAAPFVTSILAQYKQAFPHLTSVQLRKALRSKAVDMGDKGFDTSFGYGLVQPIKQKPFLFFDLNESMWYRDSMQYLFNKGVIQGYDDGTYRPFRSISRGDAVLMLGRALNWQESTGTNSFSDVTSSYYAAGMIQTAYSKGILDGYPDGTFRPTQQIKRGDMAVIIQKAFQLSGSSSHQFVDVVPSRYYTPSIYAAYEAGIIQGYQGNTEFKPEQLINRAEHAELLAKALRYSANP